MNCRETISTLKGQKLENININIYREPLQVLKQLAMCYRDASAKTCENSRVMACKVWTTLNEKGGHVQKFRFTCRGVDQETKYIYEFTFEGVDL